ncbi:MAG: DEAD/DEAH box helicase [Chloroflexi bacterium]|nr:DEAD/DEAH box helicase [Chloroflexota bacterium]
MLAKAAALSSDGSSIHQTDAAAVQVAGRSVDGTGTGGGPAAETTARSAATAPVTARGLDDGDGDALDSEALDGDVLLDPLIDGGFSRSSVDGPSLDEVLLERYALPVAPTLGVTPRPYQRDAIRSWLTNEGRGVVVLPTGAGKTVVAFMALAQAPVRTLVVVPTIDLLRQWRAGLIEKAGLPSDLVGVVGGGERSPRLVTVMTYDSASMPGRDLGSYGLLIVDEVHHLPAPTYRAIAERASAPWRLGLSATPERADGGHDDLADLIGPEVYRRLPADLATDGHIARYRERRVFVDLRPDERARYDGLMAEWKWYLATRRGYLTRGNFFEQLIRQSAHDPTARRALQAHHQARMIALNAESKIDQVAALLGRHRDDPTIVFAEYNAMVQAIGRKLGLPTITYRTDPEERRLVLDRFRAGRYTKLATGRVLNEGVDVPDARVAIVVSGSAATREYIQRLGRVLRPKPGEAVLYEIVSRNTTEGKAARRRNPSTRALAADSA